MKSEIVIKLEELKKSEKFREDEGLMYPGASNEELQTELNRLLNNSIDTIIKEVKQEIKKSTFLNEIEKGLNLFNELDLDTLDREMVCQYYDDILEILDIDNSEGLLNTWLYGFDPIGNNETEDSAIKDIGTVKNVLEDLKDKVDDKELKNTFDNLIGKILE